MIAQLMRPLFQPSVSHSLRFSGVLLGSPIGYIRLLLIFLVFPKLIISLVSSMTTVRNASVKFIAAPEEGHHVAAHHLSYCNSDQLDLQLVELKGGLLLRNRVVSIDPYLRGRMRSAEVKSHASAFELNKPLNNFGIGKVLRSEHPNFRIGDEVLSSAVGFEEYSVLSKDKLEHHTTRVIDPTSTLPLTKWIGAAGMPGMTAYYGFYQIGQPKAGETILISAASGAVGQMVGQLAKREGLKVIGSCGSDEKVEFLTKELGFDYAFNYKTSSTSNELKKLNPIDIYWDNVGGQLLDDVLLVANNKARIVACGMISKYSPTGDTYRIKNLPNIVSKSIKIQGFIVTEPDVWVPTARKFYDVVPRWLTTGELISKEDVTKGLDKAIHSLVGIYQGRNFGKAVVEIWDGQE